MHIQLFADLECRMGQAFCNNHGRIFRSSAMALGISSEKDRKISIQEPL